MQDKEYLEKILLEIQRAKENGKKGVFKINEKISDSNANYLQSYFSNKIEYEVTARKCRNCKRVWDIMIYFKKI